MKKTKSKTPESVIPIAKDKGGTIVKQEVKKQGKNKGIVNLEKGKWKKGKSGNPKGRPPSIFTNILKSMKKQGHHRVSKSEVEDLYSAMIGLSEGQMVEIINDSSKPMVLRQVAKAILDKNKGLLNIEIILNRAHGTLDKAPKDGGNTTNYVFSTNLTKITNVVKGR